MATDILRPNSSVAHTWSGGTSPDDINDEVTQPTAGDNVSISASSANGDDDDVEIVGFPNTLSVSSVSNITVWTYGEELTDASSKPEVAVDLTGTPEDYQECNVPNLSYGWTSNSFNGSWNQSELDALEVLYRADVPGGGKGPDINLIDVCYVVVTYSGGWSHKFNGVAGTNIAKINGVAIANIVKVNGVP